MADPKEYLSYFWWTKHYRVKRGKDTNSNTWCELCRRLNDPEEPEKIFNDFDSFKKCDEPKW